MNFAEQKLFRRKRKSAVKRNWRQSLAWLLIACLCITNINIAAFAAEIALDGNGLAATPSSATASEADVWMPGASISGEELLAEAERAVTNGWKFDFDSMLRKLDSESDSENSQNFKKYEDLFDGYSSFILFYDNDEEGMLTGDNKKAYGYILVRLDKKKYMEYREHAGLGNTDIEASASDAEAEESYRLTGDEEIIFLYMNGTGVDATFNLNFEDIETSEIVVPAASYFIEEKEEEITETTAAPEEQTEEPKEEQPDGNSGGSSGGGGSGSGSEDNQGGSEDETDIAGPEDGTDKEQGTVEDESKSDSGNTETEEGQEGTKPDGGSEDGQEGTKPDSGTDAGQEGTKPDGGSEEGQEGTKPDSGSDAGQGGTKPDGGSDAGQEGTKPDSGSDAGQGGTKPDGGTDADKGDTGNSGSSDKGNSQGSTDSGKDNGSDSGHDSDKSSGSASGTDSGSGSDKGSGNGSGSGSDSGSGTSSGSGSGSDSGSGDSGSSGEQTVSISSYNVVRVMGPNPDASEEDEDDGMSFEEWSEDDEDEEEDDEEYDDYDDYDYGSYEYDEDGTIYLNMTFLPAAAMQARKAQSKARFFRSAKAAEEDAIAVMASVTPSSSFYGSMTGLYKQIEHVNGDDYRLHLGVSGKNVGLDVLLVIDKSGSMDGGSDPSNVPNVDSFEGYMGTLKKALGYKYTESYYDRGWKYKYWDEKGFIDNVFDQAPNSRFSVVTYDGTANQLRGWTPVSGKDDIKTGIGAIGISGNTNYEDALVEAKELLSKRGTQSNNVPIVIFLSDGEPNRYNLPKDEFGSGSSTSTDVDTGTRVAAKGFYDYAKANDTTIYAVGFGNASQKYLQLIATDKEEPSSFVIDSNNLITTFNNLYENLKFKNVELIDTLSKYVDIKNTDLSDAKITKTVKKGVGEDTTITDVPQVMYDLMYSPNEKKISLSFGDNVLDENAVYELSFDIIVNNDAKKEYETNGYGAVGDANTDYRDNATSSEKPGFYSNVESTSYVAFGQEGAKITKQFPKPVVQVPEKPYEPEHRKYIKDNGNGTYDLTLDVMPEVGHNEETVTTKVPADILFIVDKSNSMDWDKLNVVENGHTVSKKKKEIVNDALDTLTKKLNAQDCELKYYGIQFSGESTATDVTKGWLALTTASIAKIKIGNTGSGTNPNPALSLGTKKIYTDSGQKNAKKHIILLTDGEPTVSYNLDGVKKALAGLETDVYFHIIDCGSSAGYKYLDYVESALDSKNIPNSRYKAGDGSAVNSAFDSITNSIIQSTSVVTEGLKNVTIQDTLSEYADLVTDSENEIVFKIDGEIVTEKDDIIKSIEISQDRKTVTIEFKDDFELDANVTYSFTFRVKPSTVANGQYAVNSRENPDDPYKGMKGEPGTGESSDGQGGFRSNHKATLTYTHKGFNPTLEYPHPVLQVTQGKMRIRKVVIDGTPEDDGKDFIIHVNGENYSSVALEDGELSPYIYVDSETTFKITESVPMEYTQAAKLRITDAKTGEPIEDSEGTVIVKPGDDLLVEVYNTYGHKPYFHSWNTVTNYTTGDKTTPFRTSREAAKEAAKNHPKAALTGNDEEDLNMEEGEALD